LVVEPKKKKYNQIPIEQVLRTAEYAFGDGEQDDFGLLIASIKLTTGKVQIVHSLI
jgi:hypothetical protein